MRKYKEIQIVKNLPHGKIEFFANNLTDEIYGLRSAEVQDNFYEAIFVSQYLVHAHEKLQAKMTDFLKWNLISKIKDNYFHKGE